MNVLGYTQDKSMLIKTIQDRLIEENAQESTSSEGLEGSQRMLHITRSGMGQWTSSRMGQRSDSGLSQRSSSRMLGQWSRFKMIRCEPEELEEFED
jgi:hypothetical protein